MVTNYTAPEFDDQVIESRKPGLLRKVIQPVLPNQVSMSMLLQGKKPFPGDRDTTVQARYELGELVGFTRKTDTVVPKTLFKAAHTVQNREDFTAKTFLGGERREEEQVITPASVPTGGTYTIKFDKKTTAPIAFDADAATIQAALNAAGLAAVIVTGDMLTSITLRFTGTYANTHQAPVVINTELLTIGGAPAIQTPVTKEELIQQQTIKPADIPNGGNYTLRFDGKVTAPIAFNANTSDINTALHAAGLKDIIVTGSMLTSITVEFTGNYTKAHQAKIIVNATALTKAEASIPAPTLTDSMIQQKQIITPVNIPDNGTYTISFGKKTTAAIAFNANTAAIQTALNAKGLKDIKATGDIGSAITLEFTGAYAGIYQTPATLDATALTIGKAPSVKPPTIKKVDAPRDNYCIAQEKTDSRQGERNYSFCVLLKEDRAIKGKRDPVIDIYFTKDYKRIPGGISYQETDTSPVIVRDDIRQKTETLT